MVYISHLYVGFDQIRWVFIYFMWVWESGLELYISID